MFILDCLNYLLMALNKEQFFAITLADAVSTNCSLPGLVVYLHSGIEVSKVDEFVSSRNA